jgi:tetratricopeptide (TPR) repeat protein
MAKEKSISRQFIALANQIREKGDAHRALLLADDALVACQEEKDVPGFAEALATRLLAFRHLYQKTGDRNYLIAAKGEVQAAVEIAEAHGDKKALAIPYFNLAKAYEDLGDYPRSIAAYRKAVQFIMEYPPPSDDRPGVKADFKIHLATTELIAGDKTALGRAEAAIAQLKRSDEGRYHRYNYDVWLSGGYMSLALALSRSDLRKAKEYLQMAKSVIESNPQLVLRKRQWEELAGRLKK